jgi:hypothetical protein
MGKSKAFKFAFRSVQHGKARIELFGTDRKMSVDELEQMRRRINKDHFPAFISLLWIVNQKTGTSVASSGASQLPKEPMFEVVS